MREGLQPGDLALVQLDTRGLLVNALKKTGTNFLVNRNGSSIDLAGQVAMEIGRGVAHFQTSEKKNGWDKTYTG